MYCALENVTFEITVKVVNNMLNTVNYMIK